MAAKHGASEENIEDVNLEVSPDGQDIMKAEVTDHPPS